jgi:prevent-host-death family protein
MEKAIAAFEARRMFGKILNEVVANGDRFIVERHGEPVAALVPIGVYEQWKRARESFFDRMEAIGRRVDMPEEDAEQLVQEAIGAVRATRANGQ